MKKTALFSLIFFVSIFLPSTVSAQIVINEYLPHPSSGPDWIELYSPSDVDVSEFILRDSTSDMKKFPSGLVIGPSTSESCYFDVGTRLNNSGDTILLLKADGALPAIDEASYSADPGIDISWCRTTDGVTWSTCTTSTKPSQECVSLVPTPTATPTPTPTSTPTPTPTPTSTPTPSPTATKTPA